MNARKTTPALLLAAAMLACDSPTAPEPRFPTEAAVVPDGMVPIHIRETAFTPADAVPVLCEPAVAGVVVPSHMLATGVSSHLGRVSTVVVGSGCTVDLTTGVVSINGTATRIAANGDVLLATWSGTLAGSVLALDATFTGGTGRFQNANGFASVQGEIDAATGTGGWTVIGRITPPAN